MKKALGLFQTNCSCSLLKARVLGGFANASALRHLLNERITNVDDDRINDLPTYLMQRLGTSRLLEDLVEACYPRIRHGSLPFTLMNMEMDGMQKDSSYKAMARR